MTLSVIDPINLRYRDVIAAKKGTCEPVPNNLVTANKISPIWVQTYKGPHSNPINATSAILLANSWSFIDLEGLESLWRVFERKLSL
jgi:hypothetical protein